MIGCLLIHGYTGGPFEVKPLANYLKQKTNWTIKVPALPGHEGKLHLEKTTYDQWIDKAEEWIQELQKSCKKVYVIGFSMGGMIASYLAANYPVEKLVLLAPALKYISLKRIGTEIKEVAVDLLTGKLNKNDFYLKLTKKHQEVPLRANFEFVKLVRFTRSYLNKVTSPTLIAHGQRDEVVPLKASYSLYDEILHAKKEVVFFDRSDHQICRGADQEVLQKIVYDFLQRQV